MDKEAFFAKLTNEAATPDPVFIEALKAKVITIAGGGVPPASSGPSAGGSSGPGAIFGGSTSIIAGVVMTTAIVGGVVWGGLGGGSNPEETQPTNVAVELPDYKDQPDVLAVTDEPDGQTDEDLTVDEPSDADATITETVPGATPGDQPGQVPVTEPETAGDPDNPIEVDPGPDRDPDPTDDGTPGDVVIDESFTISFWTVAPFKSAPSIPTSAPDHVISGIDSLSFDWGTESPGGDVTKNHFVACAEATKYLPQGSYRIDVAADDGVRVYVNGKPIYQRWNSIFDGTVERAFFDVTNDEPTTIRIEYFEDVDKAHLFAAIRLENQHERSVGTTPR